MQETVLLVHSNSVIIIFVLLFCTEINSQTYPVERVDYLLRTGISCIVVQDYELAQSSFISLEKEFSELPLGKIYLAVNKIATAVDFAQDFDEDFIIKNLNEAKVQSEELIDSDEHNIWYHYFLALAEGYSAYYHALSESWFSAFSTGFSALSIFEHILNSNKNFYEAYIAIGTFEYWKSRKMEYMNWLPFNNDNKKNGMDLLIVAIDSSSYNTYLAINSLIWIYIDQQKYDAAIQLSEKALSDHPVSRIFKWGMARAYEEIDPTISIKLYLEILNSYPANLKENYINEISLKHKIAQQYAKIGDMKVAINYCDDILSIKNIPEKTKEKLVERMERIKLLKYELLKGN